MHRFTLFPFRSRAERFRAKSQSKKPQSTQKSRTAIYPFATFALFLGAFARKFFSAHAAAALAGLRFDRHTSPSTVIMTCRSSGCAALYKLQFCEIVINPADTKPRIRR